MVGISLGTGFWKQKIYAFQQGRFQNLNRLLPSIVGADLRTWRKLWHGQMNNCYWYNRIISIPHFDNLTDLPQLCFPFSRHSLLSMHCLEWGHSDTPLWPHSNGRMRDSFSTHRRYIPQEDSYMATSMYGKARWWQVKSGPCLPRDYTNSEMGASKNNAACNQINSINTMLSTARSKGLERVFTSGPTASIPAFLLPAFPIVSTRSFSASTCRPSQIGRAPLSIPPEVNFNILPPAVRKNARNSAITARPTVEIEGPLGITESGRRNRHLLMS